MHQIKHWNVLILLKANSSRYKMFIVFEMPKDILESIHKKVIHKIYFKIRKWYKNVKGRQCTFELILF